MNPAGYGQVLLLDWSAYTRYLAAAERGTGSGRLDESTYARFEFALEEGELMVCPPFRFEALYSEQDATAFKRRSALFDDLPQIPHVEDPLGEALKAQAALAASKQVSHCVKLPDLMVAAIADRVGVGVLHYDRDFDTIAGHSGLNFRSVWLAEPGSIN